MYIYFVKLSHAASWLANIRARPQKSYIWQNSVPKDGFYIEKCVFSNI